MDPAPVQIGEGHHVLCRFEGQEVWKGDSCVDRLPPAVCREAWACVQVSSGRSNGACRRGMLKCMITRRGHQHGLPPWSMSAPTTHANAPHRVHTGDRQRHVHTAMGNNTSREAGQQASGQISNEKWLTARQSATMRERQRLYFQDMPYCSNRRKSTVSSNVLRHSVSVYCERPNAQYCNYLY